MGVTETDDLAFAHEHDGKRPLDASQGGEHAAVAVGLGQQVEDDFAIDRGLKNRALGLEFLAELGGIDEVAIVADGELAAGGADHKRLGVFDVAGTGGRIAHVADGARAGETFQIAGAENLGDEAHAFVHGEGTVGTLGRDDAGAFLSAMLEREKAVIRNHGGIGMTEDGKDAALMRGFSFQFARQKRRQNAAFARGFQGLNTPGFPSSQASCTLSKSFCRDALVDIRYSTVRAWVVAG